MLNKIHWPFIWILSYCLTHIDSFSRFPATVNDFTLKSTPAGIKGNNIFTVDMVTAAPYTQHYQWSLTVQGQMCR